MRWFRVYKSDVDDPVLQGLAPEVYRFYTNLRCLANEEGRLPALSVLEQRLDETEPHLRQLLGTLQQQVEPLVSPDGNGVFCLTRWPKEQKRSDSSAARVAKMRQKRHQEPAQPAPEIAPSLAWRIDPVLPTRRNGSRNGKGGLHALSFRQDPAYQQQSEAASQPSLSPETIQRWYDEARQSPIPVIRELAERMLREHRLPLEGKNP